MNSKTHSTISLFDWAAVREALRRTTSSGNGPFSEPCLPLKNRDVEISVLINEVFGGEILKTRKGKGWHFYNRVNGECIDLAGEGVSQSSENPGSGDRTDGAVHSSGYYENSDYSQLFFRFVRALEETVGLGNYQPA
ncbi:hypothetical protein EG827_06820 [bacterium]|nr:hypothetical protein [bacterium]